MRRRGQFEMAWNDDDRLQLVDWNAKHARRSFTVVVVPVYWAALWPLVAAWYCHNRSSKLDAAAPAPAEEKLLNLRRMPRNSENKKKETRGNYQTAKRTLLTFRRQRQKVVLQKRTKGGASRGRRRRRRRRMRRSSNCKNKKYRQIMKKKWGGKRSGR